MARHDNYAVACAHCGISIEFEADTNPGEEWIGLNLGFQAEYKEYGTEWGSVTAYAGAADPELGGDDFEVYDSECSDKEHSEVTYQCPECDNEVSLEHGLLFLVWDDTELTDGWYPSDFQDRWGHETKAFTLIHNDSGDAIARTVPWQDWLRSYQGQLFLGPFEYGYTAVSWEDGQIIYAEGPDDVPTSATKPLVLDLAGVTIVGPETVEFEEPSERDFFAELGIS